MDAKTLETGIGLLQDIADALDELKEKPEGMTDKTYKTIIDSLEAHFVIIGGSILI